MVPVVTFLTFFGSVTQMLNNYHTEASTRITVELHLPDGREKTVVKLDVLFLCHSCPPQQALEVNEGA